MDAAIAKNLTPGTAVLCPIGHKRRMAAGKVVEIENSSWGRGQHPANVKRGDPLIIITVKMDETRLGTRNFGHSIVTCA